MNLRDFNTLEEAKGYTGIQQRMISHDMIISLLTQHDCITSLQMSTNEKAKGFWLAVSSGVTEFNLMDTHPVGQAQKLLLDYLVSVGAVSASFAASCVHYSNVPYKPFENNTKHDFELAKGTISRKPVTQTDGILTINTNADCEMHNPQVYQYIESADFYKRVAGFRGVGVAGKYQIEVPRVANLFVDDAYVVVV